MGWVPDPDEEWSPDGGRPSRFAAPPAAEPASAPLAPAAPPYSGAPLPPPPPGYAGAAGPGDFDDLDVDEPPRSRRKLIALILGAWAVVSVVVLLVLLAVRGPRNSQGDDSATAPS